MQETLIYEVVMQERVIATHAILDTINRPHMDGWPIHSAPVCIGG